MAKLSFVFCLVVLVLPLCIVAEECSAEFSSACAARNAMNLAQKTYNALMASQNPTQLQDTWHEITWGSRFRLPGGFYAFVFDWVDHCKAHGGNPAFVGIELKDIIRESNFETNVNLGAIFRGAANITGGSWARYEWSEGRGGLVTQRRAWLRQVSLFRIDYYVGVAYIDVDEDWRGMACTQRRAHFCSADICKNLVGAVVRDLQAACAGNEVDWVLNNITTGSKYRIYEGFYTSVALYSGAVVASGVNPNFVGKTYQGISTFLKTFDDITPNLHEQFKFAAANHSGAWVSHPWTDVLTGTPVDTFTYVANVTSVNVDYFVTCGYQNLVDPLCSNCNCQRCAAQPDCAPCAEPPVDPVSSITFRFKDLTCAGDSC